MMIASKFEEVTPPDLQECTVNLRSLGLVTSTCSLRWRERVGGGVGMPHSWKVGALARDVVNFNVL